MESKAGSVRVLAKHKVGELGEKYTNEQKLMVVRFYLEGAGVISNERMDGVRNPLIIKWIRKFSKILRNILNEFKIPKDAKKIQNSYIKHGN